MNARINKPKTGATMARGKSKQDYGTPREFLAAAEKRFGRIAWDLAAHEKNHVCPFYYGRGSAHGENSLIQDWGSLGGTLWLNPPYADIAPWAAKCASVRWRQGWTLMLVPASVGTNWFAEHVHDKAFVLGLGPRIQFVGADDPYPKDLALMVFGFGVRGFDTWTWA